MLRLALWFAILSVYEACKRMAIQNSLIVVAGDRVWSGFCTFL